MREPGEWIHGKYQVQRVLGAGGMGTVYATKRRNESLAAVKVLHPQFAHDKSIRARFLEEGYLANRVGHHAVVSIVEDDIDEEGNFYIVMELLDGVDLSKFVGPPRVPITTAQALNIADQLLAALVQAHQKGIVHLDIKPANVMLLRDGRVMLLDFGIAKALGGEGVGVGLDDEQEGAGTDRYMSPEQGNGSFEEIDARADLWSVGALLMALLADQDPDAVPLWDQSYEDRAWSFSRLGQDVPPHVVQIISLALQPQKANRWVSAAAMKEAIHAAHLNLYGPLTRESLAHLVAAQRGEDPPVFQADAPASIEAIPVVDPTFPSRPSNPGPVFSSRSSGEAISSRPHTRRSRPSQFSKTPDPISSPGFARDSELDEAPPGSVRAGVAKSKHIRTWVLGLFLFALGAAAALWVAKIGSSAEGLAPAVREGDTPIGSESKRSISDRVPANQAESTQPVYLDNLPSDPVEGRQPPPQPQSKPVATTSSDIKSSPSPETQPRSGKNVAPEPATKKSSAVDQAAPDSKQRTAPESSASEADPQGKKDPACSGLDGLFNVEHCE